MEIEFCYKGVHIPNKEFEKPCYKQSILLNGLKNKKNYIFNYVYIIGHTK